MSFDTLAPVYLLMERITAGRKLQTCRTAFLEEIPPPNHILTLGEGHGPFLVACRQQFPDAEITVVDSSAGMLIQARQALKKHGLADDKIHFIHADILTWNAPQRAFDLIVAHFFLDCFRADQLADVVTQITSSAKNDASLLLADFQLAATGWRRLRSRLILGLLYCFFRLFTKLPATKLTPPDSFLEAAKWKLHRRKEMEWGLLKSDWWVLHREPTQGDSAATPLP